MALVPGATCPVHAGWHIVLQACLHTLSLSFFVDTCQ